VQNVKSRDFEPVPPFVIEGRPFIDEAGNFQVVPSETHPGKQPPSERGDDKAQVFLKAISDKPESTFTELEAILGLERGPVQKLAKKLGWSKQGGTTWVRDGR